MIVLKNFFVKNEIKWLLEYMESTGAYNSTKLETFSQQNELTPQAIFAALISIHGDTAKFEYSLQTTTGEDRWVDNVAWFGSAIQIIEWKNVQLDYLEVPGFLKEDWNIKNLCAVDKELAMKKVEYLKEMTKDNVLNLKVVSFSKYNKGLTMQQIINSGMVQAKEYANIIGQDQSNRGKLIFVHVALSVGTTKILHETQEFLR